MTDQFITEKGKKISLEEIEYWIAKEFCYRQNIIVPNISWGLRLHECDILILRPSGYAAEVEIKRTLSVLNADKNKNHSHHSNKIRELWFCIPAEIKDKAVEHIPERAGIITFERYQYYFSDNTSGVSGLKMSKIRNPEINIRAEKFTDKQRMKMLALAHMRIWAMKKQIVKIRS